MNEQAFKNFKTIGEVRGDHKRRSPFWTWPVLFVSTLITIAIIIFFFFLDAIMEVLRDAASEEQPLILLMSCLAALLFATPMAIQLVWEAYQSERSRARFRRSRQQNGSSNRISTNRRRITFMFAAYDPMKFSCFTHSAR